MNTATAFMSGLEEETDEKMFLISKKMFLHNQRELTSKQQ